MLDLDVDLLLVAVAAACTIHLLLRLRGGRRGPSASGRFAAGSALRRIPPLRAHPEMALGLAFLSCLGLLPAATALAGGLLSGEDAHPLDAVDLAFTVQGALFGAALAGWALLARAERVGGVPSAPPAGERLLVASSDRHASRALRPGYLAAAVATVVAAATEDPWWLLPGAGALTLTWLRARWWARFPARSTLHDDGVHLVHRRDGWEVGRYRWADVHQVRVQRGAVRPEWTMDDVHTSVTLSVRTTVRGDDQPELEGFLLLDDEERAAAVAVLRTACAEHGVPAFASYLDPVEPSPPQPKPVRRGPPHRPRHRRER
ncbi:hypothetical protein CLV92_109167 [Kineococcus xinjiangensis]|uniref:Uncharacterized protein n=1 Tax=Kineococcus xinjiangensis TaxID=512762 RepID=A0A2S6II46_9ACTN|nr:hypothetical protein [Kineococcus xinjiangensis]PPK93889.1 hypothetical protein CLV92_109167 [Kineococcus xinjiangensis]